MLIKCFALLFFSELLFDLAAQMRSGPRLSHVDSTVPPTSPRRRAACFPRGEGCPQASRVCPLCRRHRLGNGVYRLTRGTARAALAAPPHLRSVGCRDPRRAVLLWLEGVVFCLRCVRHYKYLLQFFKGHLYTEAGEHQSPLMSHPCATTARDARFPFGKWPRAPCWVPLHFLPHPCLPCRYECS